jgi:hypothetical protein
MIEAMARLGNYAFDWTAESLPIAAQAGAEGEVTPEMIRAGVTVLAEDAGVVSEYVAEELAELVFRAMMAAGPGSSSPPQSELEEDARRTCEGA